MPKKPLQPCAYPGCPNLSDGRYCEKHRKAVQQNYDKYQRNQDTKRMYKGKWQKIRARYVKEHPFCEICYAEGKLVPVEEVHHKVPLSRGGTHDTSNLISLCKSCHTKIHYEMGDRRPPSEEG